MHIELAAPVLSLEAGQVVTLDDAAGRRISSRLGTVWVTQEGEAADFVLGPGEDVVISRDGRTLVQALQHAWVAIQ